MPRRVERSSQGRDDATTRHVLVVCTANVCRSPVIERLLRRDFDGAHDVDGCRWEAHSAGVATVGAPPDDYTVLAAQLIGVDLTDHQPRTLTAKLLRTDGADLVIAAARQHIRAVIDLDPQAWPRTFTLRELARRAGALRPGSMPGSFAGWLETVGSDRRAADMLAADPSDDLADPYGRPRSEHDDMVAAADRLVRQLLANGPWSREGAMIARR